MYLLFQNIISHKTSEISFPGKATNSSHLQTMSVFYKILSLTLSLSPALSFLSLIFVICISIPHLLCE